MFRVFSAALLACLLSCSSTQTSPSLAKGFDAELSGYDYPFPVKTFRFSSQQQNLHMAYMDLAPVKDQRGTIVLLHGKNFSGFYFDAFARDLADAGFRVIMPDQIGFGKSSKPQGYQYSIATLAHNTQSLLQSLGISRYTLLGHSMGGMLATRMALDFPDAVEKLVLVNPIGLEDYKTLTSYRTIDENYAQEIKANQESIKAYQNEAYYDKQWKPEYDRLLVPAVGWTEGPDKERIAYTSALTSDMIFNQPVVYEFPFIRQPTILVIGQRDRTAIGRAWAPEANKKLMGDYPRLGRETAKAIPQAKLIELPGLGHVPFIEDYKAFKSVLLPLL